MVTQEKINQARQKANNDQDRKIVEQIEAEFQADDATDDWSQLA